MTTDITELAQRIKAAAVLAKKYRSLTLTVSVDETLVLVEALEKAQKSNEFLKGQLSEIANFNPDWDKLEASYESWREIAAELLVAKERIAELESRTVKLPELCVGVVQGGHAVMVPYAAGHWFNKTAILEMLAAAGIKVEAE